MSQRFAADEQGPLASRGRVPLAHDTQLLLTDVVRGSFGFVLEAAAASVGAQTSLKAVVDEVADTLFRMAAPDNGMFEEASASVDDRQLGTLREFFKLLDDEGASLRLVESDRDFELDAAAVSRARNRAEGLSIVDQTQEMTGQVVGWAEFSHRFELWPHDGAAVVVGAVGREAMGRSVAERMNPLHRHFRIEVKAREVRARNRLPRVTYTLLSLEAMDAPTGWQAPAQQTIQVSTPPR